MVHTKDILNYSADHSIEDGLQYTRAVNAAGLQTAVSAPPVALGAAAQSFIASTGRHSINRCFEGTKDGELSQSGW